MDSNLAWSSVNNRPRRKRIITPKVIPRFISEPSIKKDIVSKHKRSVPQKRKPTGKSLGSDKTKRVRFDDRISYSQSAYDNSTHPRSSENSGELDRVAQSTQPSPSDSQMDCDVTRNPADSEQMDTEVNNPQPGTSRADDNNSQIEQTGTFDFSRQIAEKESRTNNTYNLRNRDGRLRNQDYVYQFVTSDEDDNTPQVSLKKTSKIKKLWKNIKKVKNVNSFVYSYL